MCQGFDVMILLERTDTYMIYTVRGTITKEEMGRALPHEHIKWETDEDFANQMYFDQQYNEDYNSTLYKQMLPLFKQLKLYCDTFVEASPPIGGQNLRLMHQLSCASGVNIVPSTGLSITKYAHLIFDDNFAENMAKRWIRDFEEGLETIDDVVIKPGYIKLLMSRGSLSQVDQESLKAAVWASKKTGMSIHCHVLEADRLYEVIDVLESEDMDFGKFLWAHADKEGNKKVILDAVEKGMWIGFDMIKIGTYEEKIDLIKHAIHENYVGRVLISQDYDFYEESSNEDGKTTCSSLFEQFIPYCIKSGISEECLDKLTVDNPAFFYDIE